MGKAKMKKAVVGSNRDSNRDNNRDNSRADAMAAVERIGGKYYKDKLEAKLDERDDTFIRIQDMGRIPMSSRVDKNSWLCYKGIIIKDKDGYTRLYRIGEYLKL